MMDVINLGLIGAGRIGRLHAENVAQRMPQARLLAVADVALDAAQQLAGRLGVPRATARYQDVLEDPHIDAVLICSSSDTHAEIAIAAAAAGKHIFVEKPIDLRLERIDQVLAAVEQAGVQLQVGVNRRFDPTFARARAAIQRGEVGQVHLLHIISRDPAPPPLTYVRVSGGLFLDMMIHDFDMARFLVGSEIAEVYTRAAVRIDPAIGEAGDVDTAVVLLTFENGVIGAIENSRQAVYGYDQRVEVLGSAGGLSTSNVFPNELVLSTADSVRRDLPLNFFLERYAESYVREVSAFVEAVATGGPVPVSGLDGRSAVAAGIAARRSLDEHRPVRLAEV
ncbi:MAG: inositol 2-dehydrogenase [Anaerolineales bacterium]|nr:inositol 2-dehydrogenase [Anaerolineales bacterium]